MKEMLFIMVAILIPPALTYLGFVGGSDRAVRQEWAAKAVDPIERRRSDSADVPRQFEEEPHWSKRHQAHRE